MKKDQILREIKQITKLLDDKSNTDDRNCYLSGVRAGFVSSIFSKKKYLKERGRW
jgi:hypothetical protein